jgi:hypothetical protein
MVIGGTTIQSSSLSGSSAVVINPIMSASANSQTLVGLDIAPTFTLGGFTGVNQYAIRAAGSIVPAGSALYSLGAASFNFSQGHIRQFLSSGANGFEFYPLYTTKSGQWFNTGNLLLQNGGTFTDAGYRLDVSGSARITGTSATPLLVERTGSASNINIQFKNDTTSLYAGQMSNSTFGIGPSNNLVTTSQLSVFTTTGNVVIQNGGTPTDTGYRLDVSGSARVQGLSYLNRVLIGTTADNGSLLNTQGTVTAASAIARGEYLAPTLVASANSDVLVGLDIQPTFTTGSFTGVTNYAARISGSILNTIGTANLYTSNIIGGNNISLHAALPTSNNAFIRTDGASFTMLNAPGASSVLFFRINNATFGQFFGTTGNFTLQNGGTFTDAGYRLDVSGSARITNGLTVTGSLIAPSITGSLFGTSSYAVSASQAISSSFAINASSSLFAVSASQALSASFALTSSYSTNISGTANYVSKFTGENSLGDSLIYDNGTNVGIGTTAPSSKLDVHGNAIITGSLNVTGSITGSIIRAITSITTPALTYTSVISSNGGEIRLSQSSIRLNNSSTIQWSDTSDSNATRNIGLRRYATGTLEVYDGTTNTGLEANRRDLLARTLSGSSLYISGSSTILGSLNVSQGITGSLFGTASFATQALSASFASTSSYSTNISGSTNYVSKFTGENSLGNSLLYDNGTNVSVGTTSGLGLFNVAGTTNLNGNTTVTGSLNVTGSSNLTGSFEISNGTDSVKISRGSGSAGRLIISRPGSTGTQAISIGGGNSELSIGSDDTRQLKANGVNFEMSNTQTGATTIIGASSSTGIISFRGNGNIIGLNFVSNTRNLILQDGGTFTDDTVNRLQVSGSARITNGLTVTGSLQIYSGSTPLLFVSQSGNVGVGTASPSFRLSVSASSSSDGIQVIQGGISKVEIKGDGTAVWGSSADFGRLTWDTGKAVLQAQSGKALSLGANNLSDHLYINTSANVGIGTTTPGAKLDVHGNAIITGSLTVTGSLRGSVISSSIASTTASLDLATSNFFTLTLANAANTHISASNIQPGQTVNIRVTQGSAGTGTVSFNSAIKQSSGSLYTGSMIANAVDVVSLIAFDQTNAYISYINNLV